MVRFVQRSAKAAHYNKTKGKRVLERKSKQARVQAHASVKARKSKKSSFHGIQKQRSVASVTAPVTSWISKNYHSLVKPTKVRWDQSLNWAQTVLAGLQPENRAWALAGAGDGRITLPLGAVFMAGHQSDRKDDDTISDIIERATRVLDPLKTNVKPEDIVANPEEIPNPPPQPRPASITQHEHGLLAEFKTLFGRASSTIVNTGAAIARTPAVIGSKISSGWNWFGKILGMPIEVQLDAPEAIPQAVEQEEATSPPAASPPTADTPPPKNSMSEDLPNPEETEDLKYGLVNVILADHEILFLYQLLTRNQDTVPPEKAKTAKTELSDLLKTNQAELERLLSSILRTPHQKLTLKNLKTLRRSEMLMTLFFWMDPKDQQSLMEREPNPYFPASWRTTLQYIVGRNTLRILSPLVAEDPPTQRMEIGLERTDAVNVEEIASTAPLQAPVVRNTSRMETPRDSFSAAITPSSGGILMELKLSPEVMANMAQRRRTEGEVREDTVTEFDANTAQTTSPFAFSEFTAGDQTARTNEAFTAPRGLFDPVIDQWFDFAALHKKMQQQNPSSETRKAYKAAGDALHQALKDHGGTPEAFAKELAVEMMDEDPRLKPFEQASTMDTAGLYFLIRMYLGYLPDR